MVEETVDSTSEVLKLIEDFRVRGEHWLLRHVVVEPEFDPSKVVLKALDC